MARTRGDEQERRQALVEAVQAAACELGRTPKVTEFAAWRAGRSDIPAIGMVYKLFGSWEALCAAAGLAAATEKERIDDETLIGDLRYVAGKLGTRCISTHMYDAFRKDNPVVSGTERRLYSSSVIRKWLGDWGKAVERAGLEAPPTQRRKPPPPTAEQTIPFLRRSARDQGSVDARSYSKFFAALPADERRLAPTPERVLELFGSWQSAARAAGHNDDLIDLSGPWLRSEIVKVARNVETLARGHFGCALDERIYSQVCARTEKPMPPWEAVARVLADAA